MSSADIGHPSDIRLQVTGMSCASCVARVEKALLKVPGVSGATVNLATEKATVQAQSTVPVAALKAAIEKAGYGAEDLQVVKPAAASRLPPWWPVAAGAAFTLPLLAPMLLPLLGIRWMPDGKAVCYRDWVNGIWRQEITGGPPQRLRGLPEEKIYSFGWSRDGKLFAFSRGRAIRDAVLIMNQN